MASSTRSSLTPRARSWESTMLSRKFENVVVSPEAVMRSFGNLPVRTILFLALSNADVEADHAVLIARAHHRNVAIDVVFALNDLLRTLRYVRAVSKRNVISELLFDGDLWAPRRGVGLRGQPLWIDLDAADSKQLLHATAHRRVDCLVDDQVGRFVGERFLARLLLQLLRLFAGAAQRQQRDDVRLGQRRLRAIVDREALRRSGNRHV